MESARLPSSAQWASSASSFAARATSVCVAKLRHSPSVFIERSEKHMRRQPLYNLLKEGGGVPELRQRHISAVMGGFTVPTLENLKTAFSHLFGKEMPALVTPLRPISFSWSEGNGQQATVRISDSTALGDLIRLFYGLRCVFAHGRADPTLWCPCATSWCARSLLPLCKQHLPRALRTRPAMQEGNRYQLLAPSQSSATHAARSAPFNAGASAICRRKTRHPSVVRGARARG